LQCLLRPRLVLRFQLARVAGIDVREAKLFPVRDAVGPGEATGFGFKTCVPNDATPEGTVVGGFRKTITKTPFGSACKWDPVK